jgi:type IV secretory pathway TrbD component
MAICLALLGDSRGQSQQAPAVNETTKSEQRPATDQRGSPNQPLTINVVPTEEQKADAEKSRKAADIKEAQESDNLNYTRDIVIIGFFQLGIFVLQLIAFGLQAAYMRRSNTEMRATTAATTKAANATIAVERARFYIIIGIHNLDRFISAALRWPNSEGMKMSGDVHIEYTFKNYGRTPGIIREISHGFSLSETPPDPVYSVLRQAPREYMIEGGKSTEVYLLDGELEIKNILDAKYVESGRITIWFYGRFDYRDVITDDPQVHRFYFRYIRTDGENFRFQSFDHKNYNQST